MHVDGGGVELFGLLGLGIMVNLVAALWACGVAMFLRTEQAGALIQMPVFIVLFLAPVYVPLHAADRLDPRASPRFNPATVDARGRARRCSPARRSRSPLAFALLAAGAVADGALGAARPRLGRARRLAPTTHRLAPLPSAPASGLWL